MAYTRQPVHWQTDTAGRHAFERQARQALDDDGEFELLDSTDSFDEVDFELGCRGRRLFLEVKQKKQQYREAWVAAAGLAEMDLFILDELAARKLILRSPRAYLLVNDQSPENFVVIGALELITMPKTRVNRSIDGGVATFKGKWLIDLRSGFKSPSMQEALSYIKRRSSSEDDYWKALACYGRYENEIVPRF